MYLAQLAASQSSYATATGCFNSCMQQETSWIKFSMSQPYEVLPSRSVANTS
jgi:hypothetical protein